MTEDLNVIKIAHYLPVSAELLAEARADAEAWQRYMDATPEQREQWAREAAEQRAAERAEAPVAPLSLDALLTKLGWSREYAHHFVQPYCTCDPFDSVGAFYCPHADDLGISP